MRVICYTKEKQVLVEFAIESESTKEEILKVLQNKRKSINTFVLKEFFIDEVEPLKERFSFAVVLLQ